MDFLKRELWSLKGITSLFSSYSGKISSSHNDQSVYVLGIIFFIFLPANWSRGGSACRSGSACCLVPDPTRQILHCNWLGWPSPAAQTGWQGRNHTCGHKMETLMTQTTPHMLAWNPTTRFFMGPVWSANIPFAWYVLKYIYWYPGLWQKSTDFEWIQIPRGLLK